MSAPTIDTTVSAELLARVAERMTAELIASIDRGYFRAPSPFVIANPGQLSGCGFFDLTQVIP